MLVGKGVLQHETGCTCPSAESFSLPNPGLLVSPVDSLREKSNDDFSGIEMDSWVVYAAELALSLLLLRSC